MDTIPYEFVDRLFTKMGYLSIRHEFEYTNFQSPVWNKLASTYDKKINNFTLKIASTDQGLRYIFSGDRFVLDRSSYFTFEEVRAMDHRFTRFQFAAMDTAAAQNFGAYLPLDEEVGEVIDFVAHRAFNQIETHFMNWPPTPANHSYHKQILAEFTKYDLELEDLSLRYSTESAEFLKIHFHKDSLRDLTLYGVWPSALKEDLMEFACRPHVYSFKSSDYQCFTIEEFKTIIAHRLTIKKPLKETLVWTRTSEDYSYIFAPVMELTRRDEWGTTFKQQHSEITFEVFCNPTYLYARFVKSLN